MSDTAYPVFQHYGTNAQRLAFTPTPGSGQPIYIWYETDTNNTFAYTTGWHQISSSGGSPGGSNTQVQYNNSGAFGGITGATTNGTALTLVAPVLGTPASGTLTNCTGLPTTGIGTGGLAQTIIGSRSTVGTGTTTIPVDDTIPQITEGTEFFTATITPKNSGSTLFIEVTCQLACHTATRYLTAAVFRDSTSDAVGASTFWQQVVDGSCPVTVPAFSVAATSTSATTFRVRCGPDNAGTITINGGNGSRFFGGVGISSIVIREILP